jgi:predicted HicB family RNase H-like nuclease
MAVPVSQRKAADKYIKEKTDEIKFRVAKGRKSFLQLHAQSCGESLNAFVNRAVDEAVKRDISKVDNQTNK